MIKQLSYIFNRKEKVHMVFLFIAAAIGSVLECAGVGVFMPLANVLMDDSAIMYRNIGYTLFLIIHREKYLPGF